MTKLAKETVKVDQYGRVLIPSKLRGKLGLKQGSSLEVRVRGDELILTKVDTELNQRVDEWVEFMETSTPSPFVTETRKGDSKWLSRKYCLKKLGL